MRPHHTIDTVTAYTGADFLGEMSLNFGLRIDCCLNTLSCVEGVRRLFQKEYETPYTLLFADTSYAEMSSASPYLLSIKHDHDFLNWLMLEGGRFGFLGLTCAEQDKAHAHWRSLLNTLMPDGAVSHFRFYSCQTLERILRASFEKEIGWLLGPYAFLLFPSKTEDQWTIAAHPSMLSKNDDEEPVSLLAQEIAESYSLIEKTWWQTTEEHLAGMEDISEQIFKANLVQFLWQEEGSQAFIISKAAGSLENFVDEGIARAQKWGFKEPAHVTAILQLYVKHGFTLDSEPAAARILGSAGSDPDKAIQAIQEAYKGVAI